MPSVLAQLAPSATNQIRLDHAHITGTFQQFDPTLPDRLKRGIADSACFALDIHAQLEDEFFYPVLRLVFDDDMMRKSPVEHDEMRTLIARLRQMVTTDPLFDETFFSLMRLVLHHVADEEATLLPAAERLMPAQLQDMGARMARRRLELTARRGSEFAGTLARSFSPRMLLSAAGTVLSGGWLLARQSRPAFR